VQKSKSFFLIFLYVPCQLFVGSAFGQQVDLSFQNALDQALGGNPQLAAAEGRMDDARGQQRQAGLKPNPRLTVQSEDIRSSTTGMPFSFVNSTEDYLLLGQVIESGGKRERRVDVASSAVQTAELERELTRRQIAGRVALAYWSAASLAHARDLLQEVLRTYQEDVDYGRNRVNEGIMAEADLMRIQLERDRTETEVLTATRDADQGIVNLYRAMGKQEFPPTHLTDPLEKMGSVALPQLEQVLQTRPELRIARQAVAEAEANIRLQKANARTDPEAFVGYKRNVGYDTLYGAVQIDLPVRNRNQGNIASAQARLRIANANLAIAETQVRADLESAVRAYRSGRALLDILPGTLLRATETERLARAAYREGGIDLLRLLDAERNRIQTQMEYNRALTDLHQSIVGLYLAGGQSPTGGEMP
jgi:cobalt-zinc-cadmium efflux system outer membrane protein